MKLSISNLAWNNSINDTAYQLIKDCGFSAIEIAPTKIIQSNPYDNLDKIIAWRDSLRSSFGLEVSSIQSIWYGRQERLFGSEEERIALLEYTKKAIVFANAVGAGNIVFGCPRNRSVLPGENSDVAVSFFKELGDFAAANNTVLSMEANPPIYNTNYINTTYEAYDLVKRVNSIGFKINIDLGTIIENNEDIEIIYDIKNLINHIHVSEPNIELIKQRKLHNKLSTLLKSINYKKYISIEMKERSLSEISWALNYVKEVFYDF